MFINLNICRFPTLSVYDLLWCAARWYQVIDQYSKHGEDCSGNLTWKVDMLHVYIALPMKRQTFWWPVSVHMINAMGTQLR